MSQRDLARRARAIADELRLLDREHKDEIARLQQELASERELLDWLGDPSNTIGNVQLPRECVDRNLHSLRDAIRDAMNQEVR